MKQIISAHFSRQKRVSLNASILSYLLVFVGLFIIGCSRNSESTSSHQIKAAIQYIDSGNFLVVRLDDQKRLLFLETELTFTYVDTIFIFKPNGEVYNYPENFPKIDTLNRECYFFDYKVDETGEEFELNDLVCIDIDNQSSSKIGSFRDYEIDEWGIDFKDKMLYFRNSPDNTLYGYDLQKRIFTKVESFRNRGVRHLNLSFESDRILLLYKEDGYTKQNIYRKSDFELLGTRVIFKTPSNNTNSFFAVKNDWFAEAVQLAEPSNAHFGKICLYNLKGPVVSKEIDSHSYPGGGHERTIFWLERHLIIIGDNVINIYDHALNHVKRISTETIIPIFSDRDDFALFVNNSTNPTYNLLLADLSWMEIKSPHLKSIMVMIPWPQ